MRTVAVLLMMVTLAFGAACSDDGGSPANPGQTPGPDTGFSTIDVSITVDAEVEVDAGVEEPDTGPVDTGPRDCSGNPFMCVPNQRLDSECRCLEECDNDLIWNPSTNMCEEPFPGECAENSDCPGPDDVCYNPPQTTGASWAVCNREASCACFTSCNPFTSVIQAGCPVGGNGQPLACAHLLEGDVPEPAICFPPGTGRTQGEACRNAVAAEACDRRNNFLCIGENEPSAGVCQRLCDPLDLAFCGTIGDDLVCNPTAFADFDDLGICGPPRVPLTDFGTVCAEDSQCSGLCSTVLGGCSANCAPPNSCSEGALCVNITGPNIPPAEQNVCVVTCTSADAVGDAECQARSTGWVCREVLAGGPPLCIPGCTQLAPCVAPQVCDPASGRCI